MNMARAFLTRRQNTARNYWCQSGRKKATNGYPGTSEAPLARAGSAQEPPSVFGLGSKRFLRTLAKLPALGAVVVNLTHNARLTDVERDAPAKS